MKWFVRVFVAVALVAEVFAAWAWRRPLPAVAPLGRASVDPGLIANGGRLAAIGDCAGCHTAPGGKPYAGGRRIDTPFGQVVAPNITPDPDFGIGRWSEEAFGRAMREGVSRDGTHLYPAFPYDHMAKVGDADVRAVWAFVETRAPVHAEPPPTQLPFPFNQRVLLAGWKALFLDRHAYAPSPAHSDEWNRGAYLVEGLAHCGACHTPRNAFGAEKRSAAFAGATVDGWTAPALTAASPAAVPWTADQLYAYLRHGRDGLHGAAAGPMNDVVHALDAVPDADVRAMAVYVADIAGKPSDARRASGEMAAARARDARFGVSPPAPAGRGSALYAGACAQCHGESGRAPLTPAVDLALSSAVRAADPANFLKVVRSGIRQPDGAAGPIMPGFADMLSDADIVAIAGFVRASFAGAPAWTLPVNTEASR